MTAALAASLRALGKDPHNSLAEPFRGWKDGCKPVRRFGKDGPYSAPLVSGRQMLRHVHMRPEVAPSAAWDAAHAAKQWDRKTSDFVLVYAENGDGDFLLIATMKEGEAHQVARMATTEDAQFMEDLAAIAAAWLEDGRILA